MKPELNTSKFPTKENLTQTLNDYAVYSFRLIDLIPCFKIVDVDPNQSKSALVNILNGEGFCCELASEKKYSKASGRFYSKPHIIVYKPNNTKNMYYPTPNTTPF